MITLNQTVKAELSNGATILGTVIDIDGGDYNTSHTVSVKAVDGDYYHGLPLNKVKSVTEEEYQDIFDLIY